MRLVFIEGEGHYEPPFSCPNKESKVGSLCIGFRAAKGLVLSSLV
jgi:hypothetical protein